MPKIFKGRSLGGRMQFTPAQIDQLPDRGAPVMYARSLGITPATLTGWMKAGLPFEEIACRHYLLSKGPFVAWLIQTNRYVPVVSPLNQMSVEGSI